MAANLEEIEHRLDALELTCARIIRLIAGLTGNSEEMLRDFAKPDATKPKAREHLVAIVSRSRRK